MSQPMSDNTKTLSTAELRQRFLDYFRERGHTIVPSSPLVPQNDPTLLFTNAGMVQFKDVFLGREKPGYTRATTSQRCVRAGGKHNDLENVGYTARHHTFFEMLGNFSFGDYFKREAIQYAWEFLTREVGLPEERLWVTVYEEDDEAADIWLKEVGVSAERFSRIGAADNFWSMGDTGPCGPCSEIFYDHGPEVPGGPPGTPEEDGDRYVEIWNLVFMQYDRDASGEMTPLPAPCVDTGMGLERIAAVLQGVHSNYDTDLFQRLIHSAAEAVGGDQDLSHPSLKVIADHIRACSFLIVDGVIPSNEGRGYVLRRIIRRAVRHGFKLGASGSFFHKLVPTLVEEMGEAFPELRRRQDDVIKALRREEERFAETVEQGMKLLDEAIAGLEGDTIPGDTVFKLYDTYGFPVDLTADIARERDLKVDQEGFDAAMNAQRERARAASSFSAAHGAAPDVDAETEFTGYEKTGHTATVTHIFRDGDPVDSLEAGESGIVVLDATPFYAEGGGQMGDSGVIETDGGEFRVEDTQKQGAAAHAHIGTLKSGRLKVGEKVEARIDERRRADIVRNHSATHLLNAALREVLGDHIAQKGSLVAPDRLRFDFSHGEALTPEQLESIENRVNEQILANVAAEVRHMAFDDAVRAGALHLAGEHYSSEVRTLRFGDFSMELCGGTHVARTGDIGAFRITYEGGIAAGVRRIEAVTGFGAIQWMRETDARLAKIAGLVRSDREDTPERVAQLLDKQKKLEKEITQLRGKLASGTGSDLTGKAVEIDGIKVLAERLDGADAKALRDAVDQLKNKLGRAAVVLATVEDGKVRLAAGVTKDETKRIKAGDLVNAVASQVGGKGGGRPDMAQAGGTEPGKLDEALASVEAWVREQIGQ
ncbi:alanine--tRNA ligase [Natronospira bacteriovora]|uniref:Alanine--tRNA ligase n=1 Tax=Natronospira bacteriovora TaxID=3069753 RepID=A0ABU0W956_9GAMM|nr:alanine--tRNA ligase [Natronospira sp. AB-CW4]MDQ2070439.1 alanine--tRNA ligase [Natronospira sp. AB-CW4]